MKVWITKYALTRGIIERDATVEKKGSRVKYILSPGLRRHSVLKEILHPSEVELEYESAIQKAEEMRQKKIASLKKQIETLERMRFDV